MTMTFFKTTHMNKKMDLITKWVPVQNRWKNICQTIIDNGFETTKGWKAGFLRTVEKNGIISELILTNGDIVLCEDWYASLHSHHEQTYNFFNWCKSCLKK